MNKQRYFHIRNIDDNHGDTLPHGGVTFRVQPVKDSIVAVSHSECSLKDNFCRKTGRSFADAKPFAMVQLTDLPQHMRVVVYKSKRIRNPSVQDFTFTTKYFTEKVAE